MRFGVGRRLREVLEVIRLEPRPGGRGVPARPVLGAEIKFFAFDILHLDGHDLRRSPPIERKAIPEELIRSAGCPRLLYVDHVDEGGDRLLDAVRDVGAEGIVAKRRVGLYRAGPSREWLKTKCSEVGRFVIVSSSRAFARKAFTSSIIARCKRGSVSTFACCSN
jgi:bifunctional non-homologous end joining protein LigD